ncbi:hypothetical protein PCIT_a0706 [Pseudoalteromonas citrea]|uniref:Uncharacterized protein n=1 Tax=Pseudoalteromonas citrea TaxID=43655 RepID=A0AAD4AL15_9GAMM|nr:hypothetical protein PCIT_a0706 [Pseudoalteromonas citrea]
MHRILPANKVAIISWFATLQQYLIVCSTYPFLYGKLFRSL